MKYVASKELRVCDLFVKYANGRQHEVRLDKGQVLPEELIDAGDFKKSLTFGGLKNLINHGAVLAVEDDKVDEVVRMVMSKLKPSNVETLKVAEKYEKNTYKSIETVSQKDFAEKRDAKGMVENIDMSKNNKAIDVSSIQFDSVVAEKGGGLVVMNAEIKKDAPSDVAHDEKGNPHQMSLNDYKSEVDFATIKTRAEFDKLNHFDQLLFVKQSDSKELLADIMDNSAKKQIQNNAKKRLEELK